MMNGMWAENLSGNFERTHFDEATGTVVYSTTLSEIEYSFGCRCSYYLSECLS